MSTAVLWLAASLLVSSLALQHITCSIPTRHKSHDTLKAHASCLSMNCAMTCLLLDNLPAEMDSVAQQVQIATSLAD